MGSKHGAQYLDGHQYCTATPHHLPASGQLAGQSQGNQLPITPLPTFLPALLAVCGERAGPTGLPLAAGSSLSMTECVTTEAVLANAVNVGAGRRPETSRTRS
jgi:hypothetical protein